MKFTRLTVFWIRENEGDSQNWKWIHGLFVEIIMDLWRIHLTMNSQWFRIKEIMDPKWIRDTEFLVDLRKKLIYFEFAKWKMQLW